MIVTASANGSVAISVVIPTLGSCPHLRGLLERLQRQQLTSRSSETIEVLVVANLPKQEIRSMVGSMDRSSQVKFEYLETGKLGVNLARNKGFERAKGKVVLFLDDDAILDDLEGAGEHFLDRHLQKHIENPDAAAIGGPYRLVDRHSKWDAAYHLVATDWLQKNIRDGQTTTQLLGGNLSVKRSIFEKGFRFDEVIPYGGAETGFCQRLTLADYKLLYFADLAIGHAPELSKKAFCRKAYLQGAGAKWRELNLSSAPLTHVNQLQKPFRGLQQSLHRNLLGSDHQALVELYQECFEFGWSQNPFAGQLVANNQVKFGYWKFKINKLTKRIIFETPRLWRTKIRTLYAATRSIWISAKY